MGTLVAFYKPVDLSLENLIKYKYLNSLHLFYCFVWFRLCTFTQDKKKKETEERWEKKEKTDKMY